MKQPPNMNYPDKETADWRDHLFVHEYGHYVQSQQHGPLYMFSVAIPSLQSAILQTKTPKSPRHGDRWFEADASYKGSAYFDKYYGSAKDGYTVDDADYFDKNSFINSIDSPYQNPRKQNYNKISFPISGVFHWTDIPISIPMVGLLVNLLFLKQ